MKRNGSDTMDRRRTPETAWAALWLPAMVFYVPCAAWLINPPLLTGRVFAVLAAWLCLWTLPYLLFKRKALYRAAVLLLFLDGLLNLAHWLVLKAPLNVSSLFVLLNTNAQEAAEFVSLKGSWRWLLLFPYLVLAWGAVTRVPPPPEKAVGNGFSAALTLFVLLFFGEAAFNGRLVRTALPDTEKALFSFSKEVKAYKGLKQRSLRRVPVEADPSPCVSVLIMGESCNRSHMALYGYARETSPRLKKRSDLLCFTNVITPYSATMHSVLNALSDGNMDRPLPADSCIHALDVYHSAGYRTYWISNQSPIGVWDNAVFNFAKVADRCIFVNRAANSSMESTQTASYDELLFPWLRKALWEDTASRKWIVLHLMGSHSQYDKRYPSAYALYQGGKDKKQRVRDAYDNAIRYNDYVVDSLISAVAAFAAAHPGVRAHVLYVSDHGENVYDAGETAGHDFADTIPYANVEIPMLLWLSPHDRLSDTAFVCRLQSRLDWPFMTDDLFHALLDMDHIYTPVYQSGRSLFHSDYRRERPRRMMDGREYGGRAAKISTSGTIKKANSR
ncbi:MAG: phosphoethanolamine transferase [Bacteroidales bacterium]|nr:phosphoethanolamine transferase [Bacteroidales bacterium]